MTKEVRGGNDKELFDTILVGESVEELFEDFYRDNLRVLKVDSSRIFNKNKNGVHIREIRRVKSRV